MPHRFVLTFVVPLLISACVYDPPTADMSVYVMNRSGATATVTADGVATSIKPCKFYRLPFVGTADHEVRVETTSHSRSTTVHSVRGAYGTVYYRIDPSGAVGDSTGSELVADDETCRAGGASPSPT